MIITQCPAENHASLSEQVMEIWRKSDPDDNYVEDSDYVFPEYNARVALDRRLTLVEDFMHDCYVETEWQISSIAAYHNIHEEWQERIELGDCFFIDLADALVDNGSELE